MLNKLFPYKLHLQIFQQDEYSSTKFLQWVFSHFFVRTIENKKPLVWTQKAKMIYYLSIFLAVLLLLILTINFKLIGIIIAFIFVTQSYLFLLISFYLLLPFEKYQKNKIKKATKQKLESFPELKIFGITGSYGKTSVKEFLYQILKTEHKVLKTPESYNTPYGIAKVVDLELDDSYEYFICEMGAYRVGDIKEICDMVHPRYGILTGINEQHLETFGSLENTIKGKFELIDSLPKDGFGIVNIDNTRIKNEYKKHNKYDNISTYGLESPIIIIDNEITSFSLFLDNKSYDAKTKLLGRANIQNIIGAATMAYKLGMKPHAIVKAIENIKQVPHRLEIKLMENMTIIDDAYNSNVDGFLNAIETLKIFEKTKLLVTPGIVDLGTQTFFIHKKLGERLDKIDYVFLIGKSERTKGLKEGIADKHKIIEVETLYDAWVKIGELKLKDPVILFENDLPDNY